MLKRFTTAFILIALGVALLALRSVSPIILDAAIAVVLLAALYEMLRAFKEDIPKSLAVAIMVTGALTFPLSFAGDHTAIYALALGSFVAAMIVQLFDRAVTLKSLGLYALMLFYPLLLISLFYRMNDYTHGLFLIVATLAVACLCDTFAFFVGSALKGPKLAPEISPKKTISGAIGGLFGGTGGIFATYYFFTLVLGETLPFSWITLAVAGLIGSVFTVIGDLAESALKRQIGIKDFGALLPGHGGVMDRLDSTLLCGFFMYVFFVVAFPAGF